MRVLVAGHYPPSPHPAAAEAVELVVELVGDGHEIEVLSPQPSAAHHAARLTGVLGVLALMRWSRGFDRVVLRIAPGVFLRANANRIQWLKDASALAFAIERGPATTLDIDDLRWFPVGGRASQQLWAAAERLVVHSDADAARLQTEGGVPAGKIDVRVPERPHRSADDAESDWPSEGGFIAVMEEIRKRAAYDRRLAEAASAPVVDQSLAGVRSPVVVAGTQFTRRVLGSYADPLIAAVKSRVG